MKCPACERQVLSRAKYCHECGFDLQDTEVSLQRITGSQSRPIYLQKEAQHEITKEIYQRAQNEKGGSRREVCVLFADISGFTSLCEKMDAEEVIHLINQYFNELAEIVDRHGGYVDKFIGDCLMALFGAPISYSDNSKRALEAALEMQEVVVRMSQSLGSEIGMSIGINDGEVVVGSLGSKIKSQYTAIGDQVNIAQRLQSQAKSGEILVGTSIYSKTQSDFNFQSLGSISLKGKSRDVKVYQLLGKNLAAEKKEKSFLDFYNLFGAWKLSGKKNLWIWGGESSGKSELIRELKRRSDKKATPYALVEAKTIAQWSEARDKLLNAENKLVLVDDFDSLLPEAQKCVLAFFSKADQLVVVATKNKPNREYESCFLFHLSALTKDHMKQALHEYKIVPEEAGVLDKISAEQTVLPGPFSEFCLRFKGKSFSTDQLIEALADSVTENLAKLDELSLVDREFLKLVAVLGSSASFRLINEIFPDAEESCHFLEQNGWIKKLDSPNVNLEFKSSCLFEALNASILAKDRASLLQSASEKIKCVITDRMNSQQTSEALFWSGQLVQLEEASGDSLRLMKAVEALAFLNFRMGRIQNAFDELKKAIDLSKGLEDYQMKHLEEKIAKMSEFLKSQNQTDWAETFSRQLLKR